MTTSKQNIFNVLPQHVSDDEEEAFSKGAAKKSTGLKEHALKDDKSKKEKQPAGAGAGASKGEGPKGKDQYHQKTKGVPDPGTHPLERHSGTGQGAYDKKLKKGGAGRANWGKPSMMGQEEGAREEGEEKVPVEGGEATQEPAGITLDEYYSKTKITQQQPQINEVKAKVTSDQLMKELLAGKATPLTSKHKQEVDDKKAGKKKTQVDTDHHAAITSEHSDLLNFRTGFIEREFRQRSEGASPPYKKEARERRPEGEKAEGEAPAEKAEKTEKTEEGGEEAAAGGEERKPYKGRSKGDYGKGDYGKGDYGKGDYGRGGYGGKQGSGKYTQAQPKINVEDSSAFPKLG